MNLSKGFWWDYCTRRFNSEYRRVLIELLDKQPEAIYIDLGCGDGDLTLQCARKLGTTNYYGFDNSYERIREGMDKGLKCEFINLDTGIPQENNEVDVVTANQVIEHLDDTDKFLKEIYRVLRPGGYAVISTNNLAASHWIVMFILGINPPTVCYSDEACAFEFGSPYKGERLHHRLFTVSGLEKACRYYGLTIEKSIGTYWFPFPVWLARILCWLDKYHASCITLKVRKPLPCLDEGWVFADKVRLARRLASEPSI